MRKKCIATIAVLIILVTMCSMFAVAAGASVQGSAQIVATKVSLSWSQSKENRMGLYFNITACEDMEIIGASKVEFYYYYKGAWHLEETFTVEEYSQLERSNDNFHWLLIERSPDYLEVPYQAIVYFYCKGPYGISTLEHPSNILYFEGHTTPVPSL